MSREARLAQNEALFRQVNERLKEVSVRTGAFDGGPDFVCECSDETCTERIRLSMQEYEQLRQNPRRFVVVTGHVERQVEQVMADRGAYCIVEKLGEAGEIAEAQDPRPENG